MTGRQTNGERALAAIVGRSHECSGPGNEGGTIRSFVKIGKPFGEGAELAKKGGAQRVELVGEGD